MAVQTRRFPFGLIACVVTFLLFSTAAAHAQVTLSIGDVSQTEGDAGTTTFAFSVTLNAPAPPGGVTFDIATANGTATVADSDYVQQSLVAQTIPAGSSSYIFSVTVNGDTLAEPNQTFFVNVTNVTNATVIDGQGVGTVLNDDITITPIHDVQGPGASSPIVGSVVTMRAIVTGVTANGFFMQEPDAEVDADPATSEGIFVFTSTPPPAAAAFSARVQVTGTVSEFVPISDPLQPPSTLITSPTVTQLATGQPLPAPIPLSATFFPDPAGPHDQLERVEHMRVSVASLSVTGPSGGTVDETAAIGTSDGRFFGVITGRARPFREPGIPAPDPTPSGSIPPIPRWDANPERIGVASAAIVGQPALDVRSGDTVTSLVGPLDFTSRTYVISLDGTSTTTLTPGSLPTTIAMPAGNEVTVASVNLRRLFDTIDDPSVADVVLTSPAYDHRLSKASIAIRNHLRNPDIVGVQEVETLGVLSDLAARIVADGGPQYQAFLASGNDAAGLNVGFLYKTETVTGGVARVSNTSGTQVGAAEMWSDPATGSPALLNDRPPLVLEATVNRTSTASFPIVVIVSDLQGFDGIDSSTPIGLTTVGDRVRRKRQVQAEFLANYVQGRLTANPSEHLVVIGSFNAFEVNDGHVDVMNVIAGTPPPDNQTSVPGDGVDLVNPDLVNLVSTPPPAERYSDVFNGNARNLDHALVNAALVAATSARRIEHPRIAADYPETELVNATALRYSDRDPLVAYLASDVLNLADLSITNVDSPDPVFVGQNLTYTITIANSGPDAAASVALSDTLPAATTFVSLTAPGGWSCSTPAVGAGGTVSCSVASAGVGSAQFTLVVAVSPTTTAGTVLTNTATVSAVTADSDSGNNSATAATTVAGIADLSITKTGPATMLPGGSIAYTLTVVNIGPSSASSVALSDTLPPATTFVSLIAPAGWSCSTPAVGAGGTVSCSIASAGIGSAQFTLTAALSPTATVGTVTNTATVSAVTADPTLANNASTAATTVTATADVSITKAGPATILPGGSIAYTLTVANAGPSSASAVAWSDPLPPATTFVSLTAPGGWSCSTPAVGAGGIMWCSIASMAGGGSAQFTLVVALSPTATVAVVTNSAFVSAGTVDPVPTNNSSTATTTVTAAADVSITKTGPATILPGGSIAYTLTVVNSGPSTASAVTIADPTPPGLTFLSTTGACTTTFPCALGTLAPGESRSITATFRVPPGYAGANPIVNVATVSTATVDPVSTNNSASASTIVTNTNSGCDVIGNGRPAFITGAGIGGGPHVRVWSAESDPVTEVFGQGFFAYDPGFPGGVRVACKDLTGDGIAEIITGAGPGGGPHVRVWSAMGGTLSEVTGFFAYHPAFPGGVAVAAGDLTGDGVAELITGAGPGGGPHVRVWNVAGNSVSELTGFFAYHPAFPGGVAIAAGDLTGDGVAELITGAGSGGGPHVRVWNVAGSSVSELTGFFAYHPAFPGGVAVAAGDLTGDGVAELVTGAGPGGGPHVRVWSLTSGGLIELAGFFPYHPAFPGGVTVSVGDLTGDGIAELITGAGPGGGPHVRIWSLTEAGFVEVTGFFAYHPAFPGGVHVAR